MSYTFNVLGGETYLSILAGFQEKESRPHKIELVPLRYRMVAWPAVRAECCSFMSVLVLLAMAHLLV
jgi:hypothetical protein